MPDTVLGLPLHPLVVHAVVVLVPLSALGVLLTALSRTWFERLRWPVLAVLTVAAASAVVARVSGEALLAELGGRGETLQRHADLGLVAPFLVLGFWLLVLAWVLAAGPAEGGRDRRPSAGVRVLGVLAVLAGLGCTGYVVLVGHSGAAAVWQGVVG
ncbi:MAG: hypothetical protein MUC45_04910 [Actinomycetia bacterium]|jgi:hypothetical protein|nr:hypothetical protein [Actinomycetes bacterium]